MSRSINHHVLVRASYWAISSLLTGALLSGCASPGEPDPGCPPEECGHNGTQLADDTFGELFLASERRDVSVVDLVDRRGESWQLAIADNMLLAVDADDDVVMRGEALVGSALRVRQRRADGSVRIRSIAIDGMEYTTFMSNESGEIPTYRLTHGEAGGDRPERSRPVCPDGGSAMVVAGERYDPETLAIVREAVSPPTGASFRLACRGHLLWKAARMSYRPTSDRGLGRTTTAAQRRATLGMLAADYCGTGRRFTVPGTPLYWQNRAGWMVTGAPPRTGVAVEAGWNHDGAVCLEIPRLAGRYSRAMIEDACGRAIPACTSALLAESEWVTWLS